MSQRQAQVLDVERVGAKSVVVYEGGAPTEIFVAGYSYDRERVASARPASSASAASSPVR